MLRACPYDFRRLSHLCLDLKVPAEIVFNFMFTIPLDNVSANTAVFTYSSNIKITIQLCFYNKCCLANLFLTLCRVKN
jgi:hypothetical protein